jgi:ribosome-binding protein aMBF1 (putative translation factor)
MLICDQIRMSRAALGWSIATLSRKSSVSVSTIKRLETEGGLNKATQANLRLIRSTLEEAGIEFIGEASEGPGVRLWRQDNSQTK